MIKTQKAKGVMVIDAETNETMEFYAKIVLSMLQAPHFPPLILLRSSPEGMGNASGFRSQFNGSSFPL
jgi:hypothetical protein